MSAEPIQHIPAEFLVELQCGCGLRGSATFEHNGGRKGKAVTSPVAVSGEFYLRTSIKPSSNLHIVCGGCGRTQRADTNHLYKK